MTVLLSNAEIERVIDMPECIDVMESMYEELGAHRAVNRPRTDSFAPHERDNSYFVFKSMDGILPSAGVASLRINSDIIEWGEYADANVVKKTKIPLAEGNLFIGLVLLFSTETGEPLAIMPDAVVQRVRVAAVNAVAARRMAREDVSSLGLLGAGWQAGTVLEALATIRHLDAIRVYSPNPKSRNGLVEEYADRFGDRLQAVDSAREAVAGAGIVACATNSLDPVLQADWLEPGMHLTSVKRCELGEEVIGKCDRVIVHTTSGNEYGTPENFLVGTDGARVYSHDPVQVLRDLAAGGHAGGSPGGGAASENLIIGYRGEPLLTDLITGRVDGRHDESEINVFVNNMGLGTQFAAIGALVYRKAKERGIGRDLPTKWLMQDRPG